jgi:hypothetical protein
MVHVFFEQIHVMLGFAILLLKESLPLVLVPHAFWLVFGIAHGQRES